MKEFNMHSNSLSHAYIADGETAFDLAMAAVCLAGQAGTSTPQLQIPCRRCAHCDKAARHIHPDIISMSRLADKREIVIDQVRSLKKDIYIAPNEAPKKAYIVNEAHRMNINAQNAFLQILEEPPAHVVFILKTSNPTALLPTVRSRCVDLKTRVEDSLSEEGSIGESGTSGSDDLSETRELAEDFVTALDDNLLMAKCMFRLEKQSRIAFEEFIAVTRDQLVSVLRSNPHYKQAALAENLLTKAGEMLDLNVSAGHVAGMICASLMK